MTDRKQALTDLLEKVETGTLVGDDCLIAPTMRWFGKSEHDISRAFHGSLDAAKALHEAVLPGWEWWRGGNTGNMFVGDGSHLDDFWSYEEDPARAWLIAILKALIAKED